MKHLAGWRSVLGGSGAQCVMTIGIIEMQLLSVDNWDSVQKVSHSGVNDVHSFITKHNKLILNILNVF